LQVLVVRFLLRIMVVELAKSMLQRAK